MTDPQLPVDLRPWPLAIPLESLTGANEHSLPLVIEVGAAIDVLEVGVEEANFAPLTFIPCPVEIRHRGQGRVANGTRPGPGRRADRVTGGVDELRPALQGRTVLQVVGYQPLLPLFIARGLPPPPPYHALGP